MSFERHTKMMMDLNQEGIDVEKKIGKSGSVPKRGCLFVLILSSNTRWWGNRNSSQVPPLEYTLRSSVWINPFTGRINPTIIKAKEC